MAQTDKRYGCTLCTNLPAPGYLDRLETKSRTHRKYSLQHHVERYHPHVTDWTSLKRELPSVERKRHNVSSASSRVPNIRSRNSSKTTGSMDRKSLIVRLPMAQDRNTTPHLNNDHEVTAISQRLAHAANVDEEETSETQTDTDVEMLEAGTTEEFIPVDKEPHEQATKSASLRKRVATRGDRKAPATKPTLPRLYFDTFALEALEGLYGHQERLIAEEAFPSKKANRKGNKAAFDAAKANEGSLSAVRYLMMKVDMLQAQVDEAKDENVGHRKKERGYLKYIANDIDDVLGKKPVTDDVVAGMLSAQGTDESTIEQVLEQIMEEVKKQRDQ